MNNTPNLSPAQLEENARKLSRLSLLETLEYQSLIDELEEHLISNNEPYLLKTVEELHGYPELLFFLTLEGMLPDNNKARYYFHLEGVEVEPYSKLQKATVEDNMHRNIQLTLVYL